MTRQMSDTLAEMLATDNFQVTEAAMQAVLETMTTMNHALTHLSREADALGEAVVILNARIDMLEA